MLPEYIAVALQTLRASPLRTVLSTLGVVIGVGALVSILALADGLEAFSRAEIAKTTDLQMITVAAVTTDRVDGVILRRRTYPVFSTAHAAELGGRLGTQATVGLATAYATFWSVPGDTAQLQAVVMAATPTALEQRDVALVAGRLISDADLSRDARVAVVSASVAARLAPSPQLALGRPLRIADEPYEVIGVAAQQGREEAVARIAIPLRAPGTLPGAVDARPPELSIRAARVEEVAAVRAASETWLAESWDTAGGTFSVASNAARVEQAGRAMLVFKLVMGAIAGVALLVGGIGIMNVLLASVTERTREIGIRRASGARKRDIRRQFMAESVVISAVGSGLGVILGMLISILALEVIGRMSGADLHAVFVWQSVAFAIGAAVAVGLVFGIYPATRAAALSPIEALRHE